MAHQTPVAYLIGKFLSLAQCEVKRCPGIRLTFDPNASAVAFDGAAGDGQADAFALILLNAMQPGEDVKDFVGIPLLKPDAIIFHDINSIPVSLPTAHFDHGMLACTREFAGIRQDGGEHLFDHGRIALRGYQWMNDDGLMASRIMLLKFLDDGLGQGG